MSDGLHSKDIMIKGYVEALRPFQVRGWAIEDSDLGIKPLVRVRVAGRETGAGAADLFRSDLLSANLGDGRHGFVVNVREPLPLEAPASILVEAVLPDATSGHLPPIEGMIVESVSVQNTERASESTVTGYFNASQYDVQGWAYDSARPTTHLEIVVESGGRTLGVTTADIFREDLVRAGIGTGDHGFRLTVPTSYGPLQRDQTIAYARAEDGSRVKLGVATPLTFEAVMGEAAANPAEPQDTVAAAALSGPEFPQSFVDDTQYPVIVLGAARSGTSAMAQALTASGSYEGYEEGHLLDLIGSLSRTVADFYKSRTEEWRIGRVTQIAHVPQRFIEQGLRHILIETARETYKTGYWVDKTPRTSMIAVAPLLREIWPNARFIYMRRRALENIDSRLRKFPGLDFEAQCREWALSIQNWYAIADELAGTAIEIDQVFMAASPGKVATTVGEFLGLSGPALARMTQALEFDQPERTAASFGAVADLDTLGWPERYVEMFHEICGPAMLQAGYADGPTYFLDPTGESGMIRR
jgi:hypothetical protein